jgi:hypothetical protein
MPCSKRPPNAPLPAGVFRGRTSLAWLLAVLLLLAGCANGRHTPPAQSSARPPAVHHTAVVHHQPARARSIPPGKPTATYCEDGHCLTVTCPPKDPSSDWICQTSTNPAARAAVPTTSPPAASCPAGRTPVVGGGCVFPDGYCPGSLVPNPQGNLICPEASLSQQSTTATPSSTASAATSTSTTP